MPLTSWLDGLTKDAAKSEIYGGELLARIFEIPIDLFSGVLGSKIIKMILGFALLKVAGRRGGTMSRAGREIHEIASHYIWEILDPRPEDISKLKQEVEDLKRAIGLGSVDDVLKVLFRDPEEVKRAVLGMPVRRRVKTPKPPKEEAPRVKVGVLLEERE